MNFDNIDGEVLWNQALPYRGQWTSISKFKIGPYIEVKIQNFDIEDSWLRYRHIRTSKSVTSISKSGKVPDGSPVLLQVLWSSLNESHSCCAVCCRFSCPFSCLWLPCGNSGRFSHGAFSGIAGAAYAAKEISQCPQHVRWGSWNNPPLASN